MINSATLAARWTPNASPARTQRMDALALAHQTERALVMLALSGRPDAYGELVRRHQTAVYNIARRLVGNPQDALDLTQDAFVRAYDALASFDTTRPFGPWINRIVTNLALNFLERRRVAVESLDEKIAARADESECEIADDAQQPEQAVLANEQQQRLRAAILTLPPQYRAVIELRHFQELSYEEIARALTIPLSDVKSNLFRARQMLKKILGNDA